jgi:hypothetical protein
VGKIVSHKGFLTVLLIIENDQIWYAGLITQFRQNTNRHRQIIVWWECMDEKYLSLHILE